MGIINTFGCLNASKHVANDPNKSQKNIRKQNRKSSFSENIILGHVRQKNVHMFERKLHDNGLEEFEIKICKLCGHNFVDDNSFQRSKFCSKTCKKQFKLQENQIARRHLLIHFENS